MCNSNNALSKKEKIYQHIQVIKTYPNNKLLLLSASVHLLHHTTQQYQTDDQVLLLYHSNDLAFT